MTPQDALAFIRQHGVVLESAHGPIPSFADAVAGESIRGSWWSHPKRQAIFRLSRALRSSRDVLVCRLAGGRITYVHRRLWPALVRLAPRFAPSDLAALQEIHLPRGQHALQAVPFLHWVPAAAKRQARDLSDADATAALGQWCLRPVRKRGRR